MLRIESMIDFLTDGDLKSTWHRAIVQPLQEGKYREADLLEHVARPIVEAFDKVPKEVRARFMETIDGKDLFPQHREDLTPPRRRFELLMLALNYGNEGNAQRLLDGRRISDAQVRAAINLLTKEELDWVQSIWDASELKVQLPGEKEAKSLKERAFDLEERDSGLRPEAVKARPLATAHGTYRGGYFPVVYHSEVEQVGKKQEAQAIAEILDPSFVRPGTPHSHLKKRAQKYAGAISLSPGAIYGHLSKAVHDVAYREALKSVGSLVLTPDVQEALRSRLGADKAKLFLPVAEGRGDDARRDGVGRAQHGHAVDPLEHGAGAARLAALRRDRRRREPRGLRAGPEAGAYRSGAGGVLEGAARDGEDDPREERGDADPPQRARPRVHHRGEEPHRDRPAEARAAGLVPEARLLVHGAVGPDDVDAVLAGRSTASSSRAGRARPRRSATRTSSCAIASPRTAPSTWRTSSGTRASGGWCPSSPATRTSCTTGSATSSSRG
jgi:hypothetical protein